MENVIESAKDRLNALDPKDKCLVLSIVSELARAQVESGLSAEAILSIASRIYSEKGNAEADAQRLYFLSLDCFSACLCGKLN